MGGVIFDAVNEYSESADDVLAKLVEVSGAKGPYEYTKPVNCAFFFSLFILHYSDDFFQCMRLHLAPPPSSALTLLAPFWAGSIGRQDSWMAWRSTTRLGKRCNDASLVAGISESLHLCTVSACQ